MHPHEFQINKKINHTFNQALILGLINLVDVIIAQDGERTNRKTSVHKYTHTDDGGGGRVSNFLASRACVCAAHARLSCV
jgi:hypothetical protein